MIHVKEEGDYGFKVPTDVDSRQQPTKAFEYGVSIADTTRTRHASRSDDGRCLCRPPMANLIPTDTATEEGMHAWREVEALSRETI